jgi:hypothetical protein
VDANTSAALAAAVGWDGDVDGAIDRSQQAPVDGGGSMGQDSSWTASEDSGHPARLVTQSVVADRVDTLVEAMETAATRSLGGGGPRQSLLSELRRSDDPVLHTGDLGDLPIHWGAFVNHELTKAPRDETLPLCELLMANSAGDD